MDYVGFVGFKNSGKNTAALVLEGLGYQQLSFADSLKDCLAAIFQWPRHMLTGDTPESRHWREQVDHWWADRLGWPGFTPRIAMSSVGTNVMRKFFHQEIWVASVERKIMAGGKFVFTDLRYPNEIALIKRHGGAVLRIKNGPEPDFYDLAYRLNTICPMSMDKISLRRQMDNMYPDVHETEYAWIGTPFDATIENDSTVEKLHCRVMETLSL